jgi:hypothetical protein
MPIGLRTDFDAGKLRIAAKRSKDGGQARRLLALAAIYEGAKRVEAARITILRFVDWFWSLNTLKFSTVRDQSDL